MNDQAPAPGTAVRANFSPSRYYRQRRPHLFSDSQRTTEVALTREVLSHHFETLTNQKAETVFEGFALRLAEKFIAPNLRPQTGPVGGGDGKTDSETYPVSSTISERWFVPDTTVGDERRAFAFSAKKDWRGKVRSDVKSIVETKRGYPRIYFVTNQFVAAKDSAEEQDALEKKYGTPVTILDRTWLLDCVFERDSIDIAAKTLGVGREQSSIVVGPRDFERQTDLVMLEKAIGDGNQYQGRTPALAEDALRAAELARGLEKPRHEIDGRYERAVRIAREHKLSTHELMAVYGWAWTSYFWFDDVAKLNALYDKLENLAIDSDKADDLERLCNLLPLLGNAIRQGALRADAAALEKRRAALTDALERVRKDQSRPNNALHAHSLALMVRLTELAGSKDAAVLDDLWREYIAVIKEADGLGTFPFESLAEALTELGEFVPESEAFDELYEALTDAMAARKSEGEAAKKNSERGFQKLAKKLPYDAIRWFGRAVSLLVKEEYQEELVEALIGSSIAYFHAGLLWAARNYALAATTQEMAQFSRTQILDTVTPAVLSQLFECETALRRVPQALSAYELGAMIRNGRSTTHQQRKFSNDLRIEQGHRLGALLLGTAFDDLRRIAKLPDVLERLGLEQVRSVLLFLMGREDVLRADGSIPKEETSEGVEELFGQWAALAKKAGLTNPDYMLDETAVLRSRVLGCEVVATCENNLTSLAVGEALLGTLEALLATSLNQRVLPHLERLNIRVGAKADAPAKPLLTMTEEKGTVVAIVTHPPRIRYSTREEAIGWSKWLQESATTLFVSFAVPGEPQEWGDKILGEENGFSRAITFSDVPTMYSVLFGGSERLSIDQWIEDSDIAYDLKRTEPWKSPLVEDGKVEKQLEPPKFGDGQPPEGLFDVERMRHSDYQVVSPVDVRKWDAAKWRAAFFLTQPGGDMPPVLGLTFMNPQPARAIFEAWHERFGEHDPENELRISILTGVTLSNPHAYAVIVGPNMNSMRGNGNGNRIIGFVSRIQTMTPKDSKNLDRFLAEYDRHKRFVLIPAHLPDLKGQPKPMLDLALGKYHLDVRPAWRVSENDPDAMALDLDDPPVIPPEQANAPVLKALQQLARFRRKT